MPTVHIDDQPIEVEPGTMIIEAADRLGIRIPRFCYHEKLSIAANCRMCLVDVAKSPKTVPACATPVADGMVVNTRSPATRTSQRAVMKLLLANHPLDCPICDQGGACELQDVAMGYGADISSYSEPKRVVADEDIGPLIETEMTRCIHCTRCVRFGTEVAGLRELGMTGRGEHARIGTFLKHSMSSELSGNVIDLCPVGALTSKPFRYKARTWELTQSRSLSPHDSLGSNMLVHAAKNKVLRVVPKKNEALNECWLSDRDRFSYEGLNAPQRLTQPAIKKEGKWHTVSYEILWDHLSESVHQTLAAHGPEGWGIFASPNLTTEEQLLLGQWMRAVGGHQIDHRLRQSPAASQQPVALGVDLPGGLDRLQNADVILVCGSRLHLEHPLIAHRIHQACLQGAQVCVINDIPVEARFKGQITAEGASWVPTMEAWAQGRPPKAWHEAEHALAQAKQPYVLIGLHAQTHPQADRLWASAAALAERHHAVLGRLTDGANAMGAAWAGALPHQGVAGAPVARIMPSASQLLGTPLPMSWWVQVDPEADTWHPAGALRTLQSGEHVICVGSFVSKIMKEHATVLVPVAAFAEREGTYCNALGMWQHATASVPPPEGVRPLWKVLRMLAEHMGCASLKDVTLQHLREQISTWGAPDTPRPPQPLAPTTGPEGLHWVPCVGLYQSDNVVRRAPSLQATPLAQAARVATISSALAERINATEGSLLAIRFHDAQTTCRLPACLVAQWPESCVGLPMGFLDESAYGAPYGAVEVTLA